MPTWNTIIGSSAADARQVSGSAATLSDSPIPLVAGTHWAGLWFPGCPIPNSAPITAATLTLELISGFTAPAGLLVWGEASDNAAIFTTAVNDISGRTFTGNSVTWAGTGLGAGDRSPPDLSAIVAEITSRPGWSAGNALAFILDAVASTSLRFTAYNGSIIACARLAITYIVSGGGVAVKSHYYSQLMGS